jgi:hypothetical protein
MNKKQTSPAGKAPAKSKTAVRKVTVRDLEPRKESEIKGGTEGVSIRQRCR